MGEDLRIGVWICECGGNIGDVVDVDGVAELLKPDVAYVETNRYLCSSPSVDVEEQNLNRVVLACCTPNMHTETFRSNLAEAGLNSALMEIVNIREQCSWVHKDDHEGATAKALDLVSGAVERARKSVPLEAKGMDVSKEVLVIGGGVAGITASLRMAEFGLKVHLVEKRPSIGGHMIQYPKVFPTMDCSQCILTPKMASVNQSPNIDLLTYAEVSEVNGVPGDFNVKVRLKPRGVDPEKCIGCGECSAVCPTEVPSEFDENLGSRKAIYIPFPQSVPSVYTLDMDSCIKCNMCVNACPPKCIDIEDPGSEVELNVGAIVDDEPRDGAHPRRQRPLR
jgi:heterodisulfide reductase subunit A